MVEEVVGEQVAKQLELVPIVSAHNIKRIANYD